MRVSDVIFAVIEGCHLSLPGSNLQMWSVVMETSERSINRGLTSDPVLVSSHAVYIHSLCYVAKLTQVVGHTTGCLCTNSLTD